MADYFSPHAILAEQTLVPTSFTYGAAGLGRVLDPSSVDDDLPSNSQVDVPLWLVEPLAKRSMATISPPSIYNQRHMQKLDAGAECLSFKGRSPYFYDVGLKCNAFLRDLELAKFLIRTFARRYHELVSKGLNSLTGEEVLQQHSKLSMEEHVLFEAGRVSIAETERWLCRKDRFSRVGSFSGGGASATGRRKRSSTDDAAAGADAQQAKDQRL